MIIAFWPRTSKSSTRIRRHKPLNSPSNPLGMAPGHNPVLRKANVNGR